MCAPLGKNPRTLTTTLTFPAGAPVVFLPSDSTSTGVLLRNDGLDAVLLLVASVVFPFFFVAAASPGAMVSMEIGSKRPHF